MKFIFNLLCIPFLETLLIFSFYSFLIRYIIYNPKIDTIAFQSSLTKTLENMKKQDTVIFDKVSLNEGSAYNYNSGIFTAPMDGIYSFTWSIITKFAYNYSDGRGHDGWLTSTSHANIKMKKGN